MQSPLKPLALVVLLVMTPGTCFAMDSITPISKERAKEMGIEVRTKVAGPEAVWVGVEFETKGKLKGVTHVDLHVWDGKRLLLATVLRDRRPAPGRVAVSFTADRSS